MYHIKLFEKFGEEEIDAPSNIQKITSLELSDWLDKHEFNDFNKRDSLITFEIFDNLDEKIFGVWNQEFPFGKDREVLFHLKDPKQDEAKLRRMRWFEGNQMGYLYSMSPYYFEHSKFYSITLRSINNSEITVTKFEDEWYEINVYSPRYGGLNYLCDSLEGLMEAISLAEHLYSEEWEEWNED